LVGEVVKYIVREKDDMATKKRCAIVGLGGRHEMQRTAVLKEFAATSELVAYWSHAADRLVIPSERD